MKNSAESPQQLRDSTIGRATTLLCHNNSRRRVGTGDSPHWHRFARFTLLVQIDKIHLAGTDSQDSPCGCRFTGGPDFTGCTLLAQIHKIHLAGTDSQGSPYRVSPITLKPPERLPAPFISQVTADSYHYAIACMFGSSGKNTFGLYYTPPMRFVLCWSCAWFVCWFAGGKARLPAATSGLLIS